MYFKNSYTMSLCHTPPKKGSGGLSLSIICVLSYGISLRLAGVPHNTSVRKEDANSGSLSDG